MVKREPGKEPLLISVDREDGVGLARATSAGLSGSNASVTDTALLTRLFQYAKPYRARLGWAGLALVAYAVGSAGLAALIQTVFDNVLPSRDLLALDVETS